MFENSCMNYSEEIISSKEEEEKGLNSPYRELKIKYKNSEKLCRDLSEIIKNLEGKFNDTSKSLEEKSRKFETCRNTIKNILSFYLEDEYFIDMIENCFKNKDFNIEETLKTSKMIKTCVNVKSYNYILNEIIKPKLYYLKGLDIFNEIDLISDEFKTINQFYLYNTNFSQDENNLVHKFISELSKKLDIQLNENFELNYQLKISNKELDECKKNEIESKETFFKQISILNKMINEYSKLEKSLKNTIKSVESNLHNIEQNYDKLNKDYLILKENHYQLAIKKLDLEFENTQVIIKLEENRSELKREKARNDSLQLEKKELLNKVTDLGVTIDELKKQIDQKNFENNSLKNLENTLKEKNKNLEMTLNNKNSELSQLFDKNQTTQHYNDNLNKHNSFLIEKNCEIEKKKLDLEYENTQLNTNLEENRSELNREKASNDSLLLEKKELLNKITYLEELKGIIDDLNQKITIKESDNKTLENSNQSLKTNLEILKKEKEMEKKTLDQNVNELTIKNSEKEAIIKNLEETKFQLIQEYIEDTKDLVDKKIVSNHLINYLDKKNNQSMKKEVLETLSNFLNLNLEERNKIGLINSTKNNFFQSLNPFK